MMHKNAATSHKGNLLLAVSFAFAFGFWIFLSFPVRNWVGGTYQQAPMADILYELC